MSTSAGLEHGYDHGVDPTLREDTLCKSATVTHRKSREDERFESALVGESSLPSTLAPYMFLPPEHPFNPV